MVAEICPLAGLQFRDLKDFFTAVLFLSACTGSDYDEYTWRHENSVTLQLPVGTRYSDSWYSRDSWDSRVAVQLPKIAFHVGFFFGFFV